MHRLAEEETTMKPGYYREYDSWLYLTANGNLYFVSGPDSIEPEWKKIEPPLGDDAMPKTPDGEDLALFEQVRVSYGIAG
jgi:hypothetical protein